MASRRRGVKFQADLPGVSGAAAPRRSIGDGDLCGGAAGIFAAGSLSTGAKMPSLQILRPEFFACFFHVSQVRQTGGKLKQNLTKGWSWRGKLVPRHIDNFQFTLRSIKTPGQKAPAHRRIRNY